MIEGVASLRRFIAKLPAPVAVAAGFAIVTLLGIGVAMRIPPSRDLQTECLSKCKPLPGTLVDDKTYPLSSRRLSYPQVCKCGSSSW